MRKFQNKIALSIGIAGVFFIINGTTNASDTALVGEPIAVVGSFWSGANKDKHCTGPQCELKVDKDISGAVCTNGRCFVVSDEARFIQEFYFVDGSMATGQRFYLLPTDETQERAKKADEIDLEALAVSKGQIIAVGSHSQKRKSCKKQKSRRQIFKFTTDGLAFGTRNAIPSARTKLKKTLKGFPELEPFFGEPLQKNGLNIEGAAVLGERLYLGLRAPYNPTADNQAFVVSGDVSGLDRGEFNNPRLHKLELKFTKTGIRAMEPYADGMFVLSGVAGAGAGKKPKCDEASPMDTDSYDLYFWKPQANSLKHLGPIAKPAGSDDAKPEGLLIDPKAQVGDDSVSLIVFYDGLDNGEPHRLRIPKLQLQ